jgi:hypothetical protein
MALTDNLIGYWDLDEASGTRVNDHTPGTHDLTDNGTVGSASHASTTVADFEADVPEYLSRTDHADFDLGAEVGMTIAAWVRAETLGTTRSIFTKDDDTNVEYQLRFHSSGNFTLHSYGATGNANEGAVADTVSVATATDYFVVCWHDPTANQVGIQCNNNTASTVSHTAGIFAGTGTIRVGQNGFNQPWDGYIWRVGFWRRALTSGERTELYNSGAGLAYSGLSGSATPSPAAGALALTGQGTRLGFTFNMPDEA